ncbi:flavin-containing monooxygenase [Ketogulonicigenium vulgare]|uniref:flavin-containing monooxygenase n=1 Tax=Ketogulonicigenium vulgare TaxID=92945 RepID=UPI0023587F03|nr:NAD(P)/FAD-dependent oxidoreductase [Ketogulonicigenium vulgare]
MTSKTAPRVAIIGGGFSGIAAAQRLMKYGIEDFILFEQSDALGGTWLDNSYPGAEVDTPSHIYSFSFNRNDWTRTHCARDELLAYLQRTGDALNLGPRLRLRTGVRSAAWDAATHQWTLTLGSGETAVFDAVITAVGFLNVPNYPKWAEGTGFGGAIIHSARWPKGYDLTGKRVGVVGTGSTAVQIVTEAAKVAIHLTVFQREPNWVLRKGNRPYTPAERQRYRSWLGHKLLRLKHFIDYERERAGGRNQMAGTPANTKLREGALAYMRRELAGRAELIPMVTPDYPVWGKRPVYCDTYYSSIAQDNVTVAPQVVELTPDRVIDQSGTQHELDVLVLATGFKATDYLYTLSVRGTGGRELHDVWAGEPEALSGVAVPGFPNFFMMYGPNTNSGPLVYLLESHADFAARCIRDMARSGSDTVEADPAVTQRFNAWIQARLQKTVWATSNNYFRNASGKVVTQWPFTALTYRLSSKFWRKRGMKYSKNEAAS